MNRPPPNRFDVDELIADLQLEEVLGDTVGGPRMIRVELAPGIWQGANGGFITTHQLAEEAMLGNLDRNRPLCANGHTKHQDRRGYWRCEVCREASRMAARKPKPFTPAEQAKLDAAPTFNPSWPAASTPEKRKAIRETIERQLAGEPPADGVPIQKHFAMVALEERVARLEKHVEVLQRRYLWVRDAWVKAIAGD